MQSEDARQGQCLLIANSCSMGLLTRHADVTVKGSCGTLRVGLLSRATAMLVYFALHKHVEQSEN